MASPPDITPDECLLKQIFPAGQPENISIYNQNLDKCVFKAVFPKDPGNLYPACVVRIERENEAGSPTFATIAALQQVAATVVPNLVPKTFLTGKATNSEGRAFEFSVMELVEGELLEDVWDRMSLGEQQSVVDDLVAAVAKLHSVRMSDKFVQEAMSNLFSDIKDVRSQIFAKPGAYGGPHTGLLTSGPAMLDAILATHKVKNPFCAMSSPLDSDDISIESYYKEFGTVTISAADMDEWPTEAVLCHNDLSPHNLILRSVECPNGQTQYMLAGIIDWELAGFYPVAYELSLQDSYLGRANRHATFYMMLKDGMKTLVPRSSSQEKLLEVTELVFTSQQKLLSNGKNVGAQLRNRFLGRSKMVRDKDLYVGWTRDLQNGPFQDFSAAEFQRLLEQLIAERGSPQKAK